jgi:hypothetical protein
LLDILGGAQQLHLTTPGARPISPADQRVTD